MEKQFSYRITKIAGRAVAVAMCALTGLLMMGGANAIEITASSGDTFYGNQATYILRGIVVQPVVDGANYRAWLSGWELDDNGYYRQTTAYRENSFTSGIYGALGIDNSSKGYQANSDYLLQSGVTINSYQLGSNASLLGWNYTFHGNGDWTGSVYGDYSAGAAKTMLSYAISTTGSVALSGNNTIEGASYVGALDVNGDGNRFNGLVQSVAAINVDGNNTIFNGLVTAPSVQLNGNNTSFAANVTVTSNLVFNNAVVANLTNSARLDGNAALGGNDATLVLSDASRITGSVTGAGTDNGELQFLGSGQVDGAVGAIKAISVKGDTSLVKLNTATGNTTVNTLTISADKAVVEVAGKLIGNVNMGGHYSKLELLDRNGEAEGGANGMTGVLDFGMYKSNQSLATPDTYGKGTLEVGNNVNVKFSDNPTSGIKLTNADNATVVFAGNSVVDGDLGSSNASQHATPYKIYAGATNGGTGGTVDFLGRVYVGAGNLNIGPSNNTVWLRHGLSGNLVFGVRDATPTSAATSTVDPATGSAAAYSNYGDNSGVGGNWNGAGTVKVGHNFTIDGAITTIADGTGNLQFLGSSDYPSNIGASGLKLASVVFNSATNGSPAVPVVSTITGNVYANQVTIGNGSAYTTATLTPGAHILGNALTLAGANTVLNLDESFNSAFVANDANNALSSARSSQVNVQGGNIITNGATLNFAVNAGDVTEADGGFLSLNSSKLTTTGAVDLRGGAKVNVALMGSVSDGKVATLIAGSANLLPSTSDNVLLSHNSFVLGDALTLSQNTSTEDLELVVSRDAEIYKNRSETVGHFSNAAADQLGALAAAGEGYTSDMQTVFNKLDIDQWGFGNTQAKLATQVKRLAPIANASGAQAALASTASVLTAVGERLSVLRGDVAMAGLNGNGRQMGTENTGWVKVLGSSSKAAAIGDYDGYKVTNSGLVAGADAKVGNGVVGGSFSYVSSNISQQDFRLGDTAKMNSGTLAVYGTQEYGDVFVDGALAFSQHNLDSSRTTAIARIAKADMDMNQTTLKLSAGYRIGIDDSKVNVLTPMVSVEAASLKQKAYTETGAGDLSLNVDSKNVSRTRASLGLRFNTTIEAESTTFYPEFMVALNRNSGMRNTDVVANYVGDTAATSFTTTGVVLPKSSYTVGAGLRFATSKTSEVQIGYRYEGGNGLSGSSAQVRGAWSF